MTTLKIWVWDHKGSELSVAAWERRALQVSAWGTVSMCLPEAGAVWGVCVGRGWVLGDREVNVSRDSEKALIRRVVVKVVVLEEYSWAQVD